MFFKKTEIPKNPNIEALTEDQFLIYADADYKVHMWIGWGIVAIGLLEAFQSFMYFFLL